MKRDAWYVVREVECENILTRYNLHGHATFAAERRQRINLNLMSRRQLQAKSLRNGRQQ